jgi:hypothetical protein
MGGFRRCLLLAVFFLSGLAACAVRAADLSPIEQRWLQGVWPVLTYAKASGMALDVVVQPQPTPGKAPLALAFVEGRCKLVFSMRGNPAAQETLDRIAPEMLDVTLELMAAHELGHCRRYLDGLWHGLPAGFVASVPDTVSPELRSAYEEMQSTRREEGYGDLVGLAWIERHHPRHFARLHGWLMAERSADRVPGSHHDTLAWIRLAAAGVGPREASIFDAATTMWKAGFTSGD